MIRVRRGSLRRTVVSVAVVTTLCAAGLLAMTTRSDDDAAPVRPSATIGAASLVIELPVRVEVGHDAEVTILPVDGEVTVDIVTSWAVRRIVARATDGTAVVTVPGSALSSSGVVTIIATTATGAGRGTFEVTPRAAVGPLIPLAGPRSVVADGAHWTMVSVLPTDEFGNGVVDGTPVLLDVRRADGTTERIEATIEELGVGVRVLSGTTAGVMTIRTTVDGAIGPEVEVAEVPGPPVAFTAVWDVEHERADGRSIGIVRTSRLRDRFGNVLLDGTAVRLQGSSPDGRFSMTAVTIDGRATFHVEAPARPGAVSGTVEVGGVRAPIESIEAAAALEDFGIELTTGPLGVEVTIGPVVTLLGGFAADGTEVVVSTPSGQRTAVLAGGMARVSVAGGVGTVVAAEVLGVVASEVAR